MGRCGNEWNLSQAIGVRNASRRIRLTLARQGAYRGGAARFRQGRFYEEPHSSRRRRADVPDGRSVGRRAKRADQRLPTGHRRAPAQSGSGRLGALAPHPRRLGVQPAEPDQPAECRPAPARVVLVHASRVQSADAARLQRHHVSPQPRQHRAGARRRHGGPALGISPGVSGGAGPDPAGR